MKANEIQKAFDELNAKYLYALKRLQEAYAVMDQHQQTVEHSVANDLQQAAKIMAKSELNKEDLSEQQILELLQKNSEEEIKRRMGFWAVPLPKNNDSTHTDKRYIGKK